MDQSQDTLKSQGKDPEEAKEKGKNYLDTKLEDFMILEHSAKLSRK